MISVGEFLLWSGVVFLGYYILVNGIYSLVHVAALFKLRTDLRKRDWGPMYQQFSSPFLPGVAVVVPAYNESAVIVESVQSLLNLNYPDTEIVVVNDGSDDGTLEKLREEFALEPVEAAVPYDLPTEEIRGVYRSRDAPDLLVIDKENGGKSDALNAGVWMTDKSLFCAVDADSIIDRDGLLQVVRPFLENPEETVATGGTVRVANGSVINRGEVIEPGIPDGTLEQLQVMEYLRAFYSGRLGLDRLNSLLLISGAFGVFRTDVVREIGGYNTDSITEDFEIVVRIHRYLKDQGREYNVEFVPDPIVWTQVPTTWRDLSRQRRRWYRGLLDTLSRHRSIIGRRKYGALGLFGYPAFILTEMLGPLIEGLGYVVVFGAVFLGAADIWFVVLYFVLTSSIGVFLSWFGVFSEVWSFRRYDRPADIVRLLGAGVLENVGYRQAKIVFSWVALVEYVRGDDEWGVITRAGFGSENE